MNIETKNQFDTLINKPLALLFFTIPTCSVCHAVYPKLQAFLENHQNIVFGKVDLEKHPYLRGQLLIFSVPTLILYKNGQEMLRQSRFIDLYQLEKNLSKYV